MSESKVEWYWYIPLAVIGYIFAVLLLATYNQEWLLSPITLPPANRLSFLTYSLLGGIFFFGLCQFGYYIWKGALYIVTKFSRFTHEQRGEL